MPPEAICVIRLSAIGDCCHTLPVLRTLQDAWPATRLTWIIGRTEYALMEGVAGIEFITCDKRDTAGSLRTLRRTLAERRFPVLLHMHASLRANLVSMQVRAARRVGFDRARARDFQWLFTNERIAAQAGQHVMEGLFGFAEHLGLHNRSLRWGIPVATEDEAFAAGICAPDRPTCVISPCSSERARNFRNWSATRYAQVATVLQERYGARIVLTGAATDVERRYGEDIAAAMHEPPVNLIGRSSLKQLYALLRRSHLLICPDSGPAHMATAAGTPVIGLYATSDPRRTGPWGSQQLVVNRYPDAVRREFGVGPEALRFGQRVRRPDAMDLIRVEDVLERIAKVLGPPAGAA